MSLASSQPSLVRAIGRWTLTCLIINSVIGAGIFGLPGTVAKHVGNFAPWAYVLGAVMTTIIVMVVVELSSQFEKPGGAYLYVREAFGPLVGIQTGWFSWLARVTTAAAILNLLMTYLAGFWPMISTPLGQGIGTLSIVGALAVVNVRGITYGTSVSNVFTTIKLLPLVALVVLGFIHWGDTTQLAATGPDPDWWAWADALIVMVFAYSGFESAVIPGSELKNPRRDASIAAFSALLTISVLYICLHVVVMRAIPDIVSSERPLSDAATVYVGGLGGIIVSLAAIVATFGWLSAAVVTAPRLTYAMAEQGDFPAICGQVHGTFRTPWVSIILWALLVGILANYDNFMWNVVLSVAARLVVYSTMCAAVIQLRRRYPTRDAWRAPMGIGIPLLGIGICCLLASRLTQAHVMLMLIVGIVALGTWLIRHKLQW
jgi:basic amino acid/polyamine antiporter, APA family